MPHTFVYIIYLNKVTGESNETVVFDCNNCQAQVMVHLQSPSQMSKLKKVPELML